MIRIDMDMPENCYYCRFCHGMEYGHCVLMDEETDNSLSKDMKRPEWCPLSEIVKCGDITNTIDGTKTAVYSDVCPDSDKKCDGVKSNERTNSL